jgi:hypothetical protein
MIIETELAPMWSAVATKEGSVLGGITDFREGAMR